MKNIKTVILLTAATIVGLGTWSARNYYTEVVEYVDPQYIINPDHDVDAIDVYLTLGQDEADILEEYMNDMIAADIYNEEC